MFSQKKNERNIIYIYIYFYYILAQVELTIPLDPKNCSHLVRPARSGSNWLAVVGGGAFLAMWGGASRTTIRRMQRRHSQVCYAAMKNKLLCLVRPVPAGAIQADRLESFRAMLYQQTDWEPLPAAATTASLSSPVVAPYSEGLHTAWSSSVWEVLCGELGNQPTVANLPEVANNPGLANIMSYTEPLESILETVDDLVDELLAMCLCQAPCESEKIAETVPFIVDLQHGKQEQGNVIVAAALTLGACEPICSLKKYCFKRTRIREEPEIVHNSWASQPLLPAAPKYFTEESTGECKTQ